LFKHHTPEDGAREWMEIQNFHLIYLCRGAMSYVLHQFIDTIPKTRKPTEKIARSCMKYERRKNIAEVASTEEKTKLNIVAALPKNMYDC
jgi:hypothetical protein